MQIAFPLDLELELNLCEWTLAMAIGLKIIRESDHTCQFVAVNGTFEKSQPL